MRFTIPQEKAFHVKEDKKYPWPCKSDPNREIAIFSDDVLTLQSDGRYMRHTGLGAFNIQIPKEDIVPFERDCHLRMI